MIYCYNRILLTKCVVMVEADLLKSAREQIVETQRLSLGLLVFLFFSSLALFLIINVFLKTDTGWFGYFFMILLLFMLVLLYNVVSMETVVTRKYLKIRIHPFINESINLSDIVDVNTVSYRPLLDFGGWGLRFNDKGTMYSVRGNKAVILTMSDNKVFYVGSNIPSVLIEKIYNNTSSY